MSGELPTPGEDDIDTYFVKTPVRMSCSNVVQLIVIRKLNQDSLLLYQSKSCVKSQVAVIDLSFDKAD